MTEQDRTFTTTAAGSGGTGGGLRGDITAGFVIFHGEPRTLRVQDVRPGDLVDVGHPDVTGRQWRTVESCEQISRPGVTAPGASPEASVWRLSTVPVLGGGPTKWVHPSGAHEVTVRVGVAVDPWRLDPWVATA